VEELRRKSWEDLHSLWWQCCKERNRVDTASEELKRLHAGYGESEAKARGRAVKITQRSIKQALTERFYSWEDARKLAANDPEVDLSGISPAYHAPSFLEEEPEELPEKDEEGEEGIKHEEEEPKEEREPLAKPTLLEKNT